MKSRLIDVYEFSKNHIAESIWFIRTGPVLWLWSSIPIFMLGSLIDAAAMAIFFTIRNLSNMSNVVMELLETEFAARLGKYQFLDTKKAVAVVRNVRVMGAVLWGVGMLLIAGYGDTLIEFIFGEQYVTYSIILTFFWLSNGVTFLHRLNAVYLRTSGDGKAVMKAYILSVIIMSAVGIPLISTYGLMGGVGLAILAEVIILFGQYWFSKPVYYPEIKH